MQEVIGNNIDVLLISGTKLDASFPSSEFLLDGFTPPYRLDRTQHGGGIILLIREHIPFKLLNADTSSSGIENLLAEINLRSKKCFISISYNPHLIQFKTIWYSLAKSVISILVNTRTLLFWVILTQK